MLSEFNLSKIQVYWVREPEKDNVSDMSKKATGFIRKRVNVSKLNFPDEQSIVERLYLQR